MPDVDTGVIALHVHNITALLDTTEAPRPTTSSRQTLPKLAPSSSTRSKPKLQPAEKYQRCPYHEPIIQLVSFPSDGTRGLAGMDRYLKEESDVQYAVFLRPDDGLLSLEKNCICGQNPKKDNSKL